MATSAPALPARARRSRPRRVLLALALATGGGAFTALGMLGLYLRSDDFERRATSLVERAVEAQTGESATLGGVHVSFWPPAVELDGFHIWDTESGDTIGSAERIYAPFVLVDGGVGVGNLELQSPVLELHVEPDGQLREFEKAAPGSGEPMKRLPWTSLTVTDGTLRVAFPDGDVELAHVSTTPVAGPITDVHAKFKVVYATIEQSSEIDLKNVTLGPDLIAVPKMDVDTPILSISGRGEYPLGGKIDARVKGTARLEELAPLFDPGEGVLGHVEFDVGLSGEPDDLRADAALLGDDVELDIADHDGTILQHRLGTISAGLTAGKQGVDVEKAVLKWGDGRITVFGHVDPDLKVTDAHVIGEDLSLGHILRQLDAFDDPWVDMKGDVDIDATGTLKPFHLEGPVDVALQDLIVRSGPYDSNADVVLHVPRGTVRGRVDAEQDQITIYGDEVTGPKSRGKAVAVIPYGPEAIDVRADMTAMDLSDLRPLGDSELTGRGRVVARIWGTGDTMQADGTADLTGFGVTGLPYADHIVAKVRTPDMENLFVEDAQAIKGATPYSGKIRLGLNDDPMTMDLDIDVPKGGRIEDVVGIFVDLDGLKGGIGGTVSLHGPIYDLTGESHVALKDVDLYGEKFPSGEGHGYMDEGLFTLDDLRLVRGEGEGLFLRGGVGRHWALDMELAGDVSLDHSDLLAPAALPLSGKLEVLARIDNTLFEPAPHGRITVTDVRYAGGPVDDSVVDVDTKDGVAHYVGRLVGDSVRVDGTLGLWDDQPYALTAAFDAFPAHLLHPVAADGGAITASLSGGLALHGNFGEHPSPVDIVADAKDVEVKWGTQDLHDAGAWHYEQHGKGFDLQGFGLEGGRTKFTLDAKGGDQPLDVAGAGTIDLDLLRMVVPGLTRADGVATVAVAASGRAPDVQASVDVDVQGDLLRDDSFPGTLEDVTGHVHATKDGYTVSDVKGALGGGTVAMSGRIDADHWRPTRYDLEADVHGSEVQWVDYLPPAIGDAHVTFDGPSNALLLAGNIDVTEMTFSDRIDWQDWVVEWQKELLVDGSADDETPMFSFDLHLGADKTIRLRNNVADGVASADLRVIGDTSRPGLVGTVAVQDGEFYLQDRKFEVDRGEVAFRDPWTWDPDLDFDLVTDIDSKERRYRINYLVQGPFSDWQSTASSDPPLPQADINALLLFGVTADELEDKGELGQAVGQNVANLLVNDFLVTNQAAQELRNEFALLDRVDLVTGVNARGEYSSDPRVLVEKHFDDLWGVDVTGEINLVQPDDQYWRLDRPLGSTYSLSLWYATRQRDRVLQIGGAYGADVRARWELD